MNGIDESDVERDRWLCVSPCAAERTDLGETDVGNVGNAFGARVRRRSVMVMHRYSS
jgi:hypothetical protein